jgi:hypothetical protein
MSASVRDRALAAGQVTLGDDAFLEDLQALRDEAELEAGLRDLSVGYGLAQLSEALDSVAPAPDARARLIAEVPAKGRFEQFAEATAKMLDLGIEQAKALLDRLEDKSIFSDELPGISFFWCEGGPAVANAVRGFVRVKAGTAFPNHEHIGDEIVLVLQGTFVDTTRGITFHVGDSDTMKAGTSHEYLVPEGGPDLLKLSVTQAGLRAMGLTYLPR